jgi:hypothetical protein
MNRMAAAVAVCSMMGCATGRAGAGDGHWASLPVLGPLEAGLLYYDRSDTPPDPRLVFAWGDVCGVVDEEERAQAVTGAQPRLRQAAKRVDGKASWLVPLRQSLGNYDIRRGGFPTGIRQGSVVRFDRGDFCHQELGFLVAFRNGDATSLLRIPEEEAKQLVRTNPGRAVVHDLEVEVVGWQPGPPGPTLLVDIVRVRTRDAQSGRVVYDSEGATAR